MHRYSEFTGKNRLNKSMGNQIKTIGMIIVALLLVGVVAIISHYFTNTTEQIISKEHEDDVYLSGPLPRMRGQSNNNNNPDPDQIAGLDRLLESWDTELILNAQRDLENLNAENPDQPQVLYRLAMCCHHLVEIDRQLADRSETIQKGISFCRRALKLDKHNAEVHKWYAILVGLRADLNEHAIKDRVADGTKFRRHIEIALELSPNDDCLHFVMGRYMYEVSSLSWAQRNLANWLYDAQLNATYEDALRYFLKADQLNSNWKENMMYVGKCYNIMGNYAEGTRKLQIARNLSGFNKELPIRNINDEIEDALRQYS